MVSNGEKLPNENRHEDFGDCGGEGCSHGNADGLFKDNASKLKVVVIHIILLLEVVLSSWGLEGVCLGGSSILCE